jgi:hypothetical protein
MIECEFSLPVSAESFRRMMKVEKLRAAFAVAQERFDAAITAAALAECWRSLKRKPHRDPSVR